MQFLRGLNDQYSNVKYYVRLMESVPPIPKIFSLAAQQERQLSSNALIANTKNAQPMVNKSKCSLMLFLVFVARMVIMIVCVL